MPIDSLAQSLMPFALVWFVVLMALRTAVVLRRGYKVELGVAKGDPRRGILYSLTFSMLPWKKDSTRRHPWSYAAGMGMHIGLAAALLLAISRNEALWPAWAVLPSWAGPLLGMLAGLGLVSAVGLFLKRSFSPQMHAISSPDDFLSNLLLQLYLLGACLTAFVPAAVGFWRLAAVLLLFYIPVGKIYHMVLFFVSRTLFGLQFGRRGVLQHDLPVSY